MSERNVRLRSTVFVPASTKADPEAFEKRALGTWVIPAQEMKLSEVMQRLCDSTLVSKQTL
jgi:hypothetical protein